MPAKWTKNDASAASRRSIILIASKIARKRRRRSGAINDELKWKTRRMNRRRFIKVPVPRTESIFLRSFRDRYSNSCGKRAPSPTAREIYLSRGNCDGDGSIEKIAVKRGNRYRRFYVSIRNTVKFYRIYCVDVICEGTFRGSFFSFFEKIK